MKANRNQRQWRLKYQWHGGAENVNNVNGNNMA
jgi:hypothetical protein